MERTRSGAINILKDLIKESGKNFLMGSARFRKWRASRPRAGAYYTGSDEELERYAFLGLNLLRQYTGEVKGKSVCEIGAGDFLTSGLALLGAGAKRYAVIEYFPGDYKGEAAKRWYRAIEENWSRVYPEIPWAEDLKSADFPENYAERLEIIQQTIETARTESKFDIVCSFQVGEHIRSLNSFAEMTKRLLNERGVALHRVDFGPHDSWHAYADPLTFLRFSEPVWNLTGSNRGTPNRFRHHEFMDAFKRAGLQIELADIAYFDEKTIDFTRLQPKFQKMPRESMLVGTALYLLRQNP